MPFNILLGTLSILTVLAALIGLYEYLYKKTVLLSGWNLLGYCTIEIWALALALLATDALYAEWVMISSWVPFTIAAIGHIGYRRTNAKAIAEFERQCQIETIHTRTAHIVEQLQERAEELRRRA